MLRYLAPLLPTSSLDPIVSSIPIPILISAHASPESPARLATDVWFDGCLSGRRSGCS